MQEGSVAAPLNREAIYSGVTAEPKPSASVMEPRSLTVNLLPLPEEKIKK